MTLDARGGLLVAGRPASGLPQHYMLKGSGTVSIDPPSITAGASATATGSIPGAKVGDLIFLVPPSSIEDDLVFQGAAITASDTVTVRLSNEGTAAVDGAAREWAYLLFAKS